MVLICLMLDSGKINENHMSMWVETTCHDLLWQDMAGRKTL
jgi:hypothetical protein